MTMTGGAYTKYWKLAEGTEVLTEQTLFSDGGDYLCPIYNSFGFHMYDWLLG